MAARANLNAIFEPLTLIPIDKIQNRAKVVRLPDYNKDEETKTTRRLAIGFASLALFANSYVGRSVADDNGFWLNGPLPVPHATNSKSTNMMFLLIH